MLSPILYPIIKRTIDISGAASGLILTSPILLVLAAIIKLTSKGPILYRGNRVGRYGKSFDLLKFRTMVPDAERLGGSATANDDIRLTSVGRKIRKYKLDELPQLWNVLKGDMSLVGPRPEVEKYVKAYTKAERCILELPPGITDWATIWNSDEGAVLAGKPDPEKAYEEIIRPIKTELQLLYYRRRSLTTDTKIVFHTAIKIFVRNWVPKELAAYGTSLHPTERCERGRKALAEKAVN